MILHDSQRAFSKTASVLPIRVTVDFEDEGCANCLRLVIGSSYRRGVETGLDESSVHRIAIVFILLKTRGDEHAFLAYMGSPLLVSPCNTIAY